MVHWIISWLSDNFLFGHFLEQLEGWKFLFRRWLIRTRGHCHVFNEDVVGQVLFLRWLSYLIFYSLCFIIVMNHWWISLYQFLHTDWLTGYDWLRDTAFSKVRWLDYLHIFLCYLQHWYVNFLCIFDWFCIIADYGKLIFFKFNNDIIL